jgi:hypothetical protein
MLRSGRLLGHASPLGAREMTMLYLEVALTDFAARVSAGPRAPRHLAPQPKTQPAPTRAGLNGVIDSLLTAQHVMEMYRRNLPDGAPPPPAGSSAA